MYDPENPRILELIADTERYMIRSTKHIPFDVWTGEGCWVWDKEGNKALDCFSGVGIAPLGRHHPAIEAIDRRWIREKLADCAPPDCYTSRDVELAKRLAELAPGDAPKKVLFKCTGTEAVEAAIKLALDSKKNPEGIFIGMEYAFHGRTFGSLSLNASKSVHTRGFPKSIRTVAMPFPHSGLSDDELNFRTRLICEYMHKHQSEVNAIVFEPIQGEGGIYPADLAALHAIVDTAQELSILVIADEVQTGMGRTGKVFASGLYGIEPDIICVAKALGVEEVLSAVIARADLDYDEDGRDSNTHGGKGKYVEKAGVLLDILTSDGFLASVRDKGQHLMIRLKILEYKYPEEITHTRGHGLMQGVEFSSFALRDKVRVEMLKRRVLALSAGAVVPVLRFLPPLIITKDELDFAIDTLEESLQAAL